MIKKGKDGQGSGWSGGKQLPSITNSDSLGSLTVLAVDKEAPHCLTTTIGDLRAWPFRHEMYISVVLVDASNVLAYITFQLPSITPQNIRQGWTLDLWLVFDPCLFQETVTWLEFPRKLWYVGVAFDSLLQNVRLEKSPSKIAFLKYTPLKQIVQCTNLISRMTILFQRIIIPYQHQPTMSQGSRNWFTNSTSSSLPWSRGSFLEGSLFSFCCMENYILLLPTLYWKWLLL